MEALNLERAADDTADGDFIVNNEDRSPLPERAGRYSGADEVHTPPGGTGSPGGIRRVVSNVTEWQWRGYPSRASAGWSLSDRLQLLAFEAELAHLPRSSSRRFIKQSTRRLSLDV